MAQTANHQPMPGAIVLCGGRSSRMQRDKASLPIGDETFLQRICRIVGQVTARTVVVAAAGQQLPELPNDVVVVRDPVPHEGPLAGFLTGLRALRQAIPDTKIVWAGSCDTPFVSTGVVRRLMRLIGHHDASLIEDERGLHPLGAVYRVECELILRQLVEQGERRLLALPERLQICRVPARELCDLDADLRCLWNVNSPDMYRRILKDT